MDSKLITTILLRMPNWLGDNVMCASSVQKLKDSFPNARFIIVGSEVCRVFARDKRVEKVIIDTSKIYAKTQKNAHKQALQALAQSSARGRFLQRLRLRILYLAKFWQRNRIYATFLLAQNARGAQISISFNNGFFGALFLFFARSKIRIGYGKNLRGLLLTHCYKIPCFTPLHQVQKYEFLLHEIIDSQILNTLYPLCLPRGGENGFKDENILQGFGESKETNLSAPKYIGINPGAAFGSAKCWEESYFIEVIKFFLAQGHFVALFGSDAMLSARINAGLEGFENEEYGLKNFIDLTNKTTLYELVDSLGALDLFITNDSGPMHIASALGTPFISIFGPTDMSDTCGWNLEIAKKYFYENALAFGVDSQKNAKKPTIERENLVLTKNATILCKHLPCAPCKKRVCPLKHHQCMKDITPELVISTARQMQVV
ncbi:glycosyltransferase family 9 protein [Helicobacter himalayensis]|uniref:glycosyltransferase family 9 protein n=1 Tax=Helicobacter himalayensis TaxID=1591088 RepID=UPI003D6EA5E6